ncbi:MAG: DUF1588 domain-containing protein [Bryobacteraceae bacterium]
MLHSKSIVQLRRLSCCILLALPLPAQQPFSFAEATRFLNQYCSSCHRAKAAVGGFRLERLAAPSSLRGEAQKWASAARRVNNGEMPPKGSPAPPFALRVQFAAWTEDALRTEACAAAGNPVPAPARRLNRDEYAATIRDLLDIHLDIGSSLPADGAGGEGFDNAAETLFLSPLHAEKYLETASFALDFAAKEYKSRAKVLIAEPGPDLPAGQAARKILSAFLPRAFRSPVEDAEVGRYLSLYHAAREQNQTFEEAAFFALRAALVSPRFLFRTEPAGDYALASRLSYFLWGSMPDELLFDVAASGRLREPEILRALIPRMLRNDRSLAFANRFVEQWLRTRELGGEKAPDPQLFPEYTADEELRSDIRYQPFLFFRELFIRDMSLLNLIDSAHTIGTDNLADHYGVKFDYRQAGASQPQWVPVPPGSGRGGLLGMAAVLAVSSHPYRSSPVLRGAWILDSMLGTPPPPPPPDVPPLEEVKEGAPASSVRERLTAHRENPACAACHNNIDPIGFALENYDPIGRWRDYDSGRPVDNSARLADGSEFRGPAELKAYLMKHRDMVIRNLASRMLGYALGRGLTLADACTVDSIVSQVRKQNYRAQALIEAIVLSDAFRLADPQSTTGEPGTRP